MCPSYLENYEDNLKIDKEQCIFCGRCADRCILDNIRMQLAPCRGACPMGVNVQGYVQLIKRGQFEEARNIVREKLPFPEVMCMACHHPCEQHCQRGKDSDPVAIRSLKRFLFDGGYKAPLPAKAASTGKRMAVVGAGPAGLVAAHDLACAGHDVTVYEARERAGGMLWGGIPAYRLPQEVLDRELAVLPELGVHFVYGSRVGKDVRLQSLMTEHDAVLLTTGLWQSRKLNVPGEDMEGVYAGLPFLEACRQGRGPTLAGTVLVCGGGNMAIDAAMTALRQGAAKVVVLTLEAEGQLPAFAEEVRQARLEGVEFHHNVGIASVGGLNGCMDGVVLHACIAMFDAEGRFAPRFERPVDHMAATALIVAIGACGDATILHGSGLTADDIQNADPLTLQCGTSNVFAAGDCQSGAGSIIKAMAAGREAAISAHRLAHGEHLRFERAYAGPVVTDFPIDTSNANATARQIPRQHSLCGQGDYAVLEHPFTEAQAKAEAQRCLSCGGPCGKHRTCWFCLPCEVACPQKALWVDIPYLLR